MENENLITTSEFTKEAHIAGRTLRNYVEEGVFPSGKKISGQGNQVYWDRRLLRQVKVIERLVGEGENLGSIKKILEYAQASGDDILNYVYSTRYIDIRQGILQALKSGKTLKEAKKEQLAEVKTKVRENITNKLDRGRYKKLTDNFIRFLLKYKALFPEAWGDEEILDYFGFKEEAIDFSDRKSVRIFKINFFKKLAEFLRKYQNGLQEDIEFCEESAKGLEEIHKKLR